MFAAEPHCTVPHAWCIIRAWCRWLHLVLKSMSLTLRVALHSTTLQHTMPMQSEWLIKLFVIVLFGPTAKL